ncbi:hypothetical protein OLMES_2797 [Oleiphilus messinensis]|uniref:Uncharacterized protein n=1 Tax=Oleiphilus messinensis TaxID=141451 RepID=A0A1Y0IBK5_9GAMM|nr:hypothetical protein [Oleiphilus messinensis]ARU56845.1 hypothetical protein OLMES_2797 [Oleiphilus messinensis]
MSQPKACRCTGKEKTTIEGLSKIPSYTGDFPSPLQVMWYVPEQDELFKLHISDTEIRRWIREAAEYHGIPHVLLAIILQQENGPNATAIQKAGQFAERTITTFGAIVDKRLWDIFPDAISKGSSGFANMSRGALLDASKYTENNYGRNPLSNEVRYRAFGIDQDTRVSGDDWKADLYYCSAHLRQLIDRVTGSPCHNGALTMDQLREVIKAYNGSGPMADKYADDAMKTLKGASTGASTLYFYEQ